MSALAPLANFLEAASRQAARRDRYTPFRELVDALDRDREARKVGKRDPYFEKPAFGFLKQDVAADVLFVPKREGER